jgi:hypothetical protein
MIIEINNDLFENKTNEEIIKILKDILNFDFKYPGINIYGGSLQDLQEKPKFITKGG